jgi:hypothetical protein
MVNNNDFTLFVFILKQLWNPFVPLNVSTREVKCLLNVKLFVFIRFTKINQYKICINASGELLSFDGNWCKAWYLTDWVIFGFFPVVNGLTLRLLIEHFPQSCRFDSSERFILFIGDLFVAWIKRWFYWQIEHLWQWYQFSL